MAKALGLVVTVVVLEVGVLLSAVVPGEFKKTLAVPAVAISRNALLAGITQEVKVKATLGVFHSAEEGHAQNVLVELERLLNVLDSQHGVVHAVGADIRRGDVFSFLQGFKANYLDPIRVLIQSKGNVSHGALVQRLLELVAGVEEALAGRLDVVHADASVAKSTVGLFVAIVDLEVGVVFRAVVVSELNNALSVGEVLSVGDGVGAVVGQEVEVELGFGELEVLDDLHSKELVESNYFGVPVSIRLSVAAPFRSTYWPSWGPSHESLELLAWFHVQRSLITYMV